MIFTKSKILLKFFFISLNLVYKVITAPYTLKGSGNIQGFVLIRAPRLRISEGRQTPPRTLVWG